MSGADRGTDAIRGLRAELGDDLAVLDELTDDECAELLSMVRTAKVDQRKAIDDALNEVLRYLPRLVRGPARKILFG
ncbi:MAG TPA: hypothetical protein VFE65_20780 [Pseudonocardia sp.]|nr:hypothetical protein [Pseudonocardia sp.]